MTTNQTIDGVPRELLEQLVDPVNHIGRVKARAELRALLDAADHVHEWDINAEGTATVCHCGARSSDEQPAPVAVVMPDPLPGDDGVCTESHYASGWNDCLDELKRLNTARPAHRNPPPGTEPSGTHHDNDGLDDWRKP